MILLQLELLVVKQFPEIPVVNPYGGSASTRLNGAIAIIEHQNNFIICL